MDPAGISAQALLIEATGAKTHLLVSAAAADVIIVGRERLDLTPADEFGPSLADWRRHRFGTGARARL